MEICDATTLPVPAVPTRSVHRGSGPWLLGLLAIITRQSAPCQDPVRRDDELLDRL
ncbi:hypothetical protein [Kribbella sindirgiensis]|uniref:hypothetical protein n=1 Tax=Kribbella sindirgiensis TaxID=1124744 RepID=UPI0013F3A3D9|nr:hypothetical protein [Kribbella sindirgiensis]